VLTPMARRATETRIINQRWVKDQRIRRFMSFP
jgi:hypothetical protein